MTTQRDFCNVFLWFFSYTLGKSRSAARVWVHQRHPAQPSCFCAPRRRILPQCPPRSAHALSLSLSLCVCVCVCVCVWTYMAHTHTHAHTVRARTRAKGNKRTSKGSSMLHTSLWSKLVRASKETKHASKRGLQMGADLSMLPGSLSLNPKPWTLNPEPWTLKNTNDLFFNFEVLGHQISDHLSLQKNKYKKIFI